MIYNMKNTISRLASVLAVFSMALGTIIGCGPEEQPGGNESGNKTVAVTGVSLNKASMSLTEGGSESLTAKVTPDNASNKSVSWKSSDASVASVDNSGKVTAVKAGTATITAKCGDKEATCAITVIPNKEDRIKAVLMKIYDAMEGSNWKMERKWSTSKSLDLWDGVVYDKGKDELTLSFQGYGLKGQLPDCIGELTNLRGLDIREPGITGTLPESFSNLVELEALWIWKTGMTSLPDIFTPLVNLKEISIYDNKEMTGPLPESLCSSDKLEYINIYGNAFTGTVPASWAKHRMYMTLWANHLSGEIPESFLKGTHDEVASGLESIMNQQTGFGFDISGIEIPGYWPAGDVVDMVTNTYFNFADVVKNNRYTVYLSWADWCPFSKVLLPQLTDYYNKYKEDGLGIIATMMNPDSADPFNWSGAEDRQLNAIRQNGFTGWYNFYFGDYYRNMSYPSATPSAEVYDSDGNVLFSSFSSYSDPVRNRYGHKAFTDLMPFLESLLGPAEGPEVYESTDFSKDGEVMTLQKASVGKGINIVFMGDAYTDRDMDEGGLYETLMRQSMEEFFAIEPYKTFRNRFNVYAVKVVSKNDRSGNGCSTALGVEVTSISISTGDTDKCYGYALKVPGIEDRQNLTIGVLANSGNSLRGITTMNESSQSGVAIYASSGNDSGLFGTTIRHEAGGHAFAFLDDEYSNIAGEPSKEYIDYRNSMYEQFGWYSNVDFTDDPEKVKWSAFLSDERYKDEVGVIEGGSLYSKGVYRPSGDSMMNQNAEYFNAPSRWAIYKRIMELSGETASFDKFLEYDAVNRGKQ